MPDDILISELSNAPQIDDSAVFPFSQDNGGTLATFKSSMSDIAGKVAEGTTYTNLQTTSKNLVGAINEVAQGGGGSADIISEASGTIATFSDGGDNIPVKSLVTEVTATQAGTGTPSPDNVRAITGFDTVDLSVENKNLCEITEGSTTGDISFIMNDDGTVSVSGSISTGNRNANIGHFILPVGTYTMSGIPDSLIDNVSRKASIVLCKDAYSGSVNIIKTIYSNINPTDSFTLTEATNCYMRIYVYSAAGTLSNVVFSPQIEKGEDATSFIKHQGTTHVIPLGQTIYGGTAELVGGNGTKTFGYIEFDGSSDEDWTYASGNKWATITIPDMMSGANQDGITNWLPKSTSYGTFGFALGRNNNNFYAYQILDISGVTDLASWKTYLSNNPLQVVYPLATPTAFAFGESDIPTLSGLNNIYSSTGDVEIEYFNENADQTSELIDAKQEYTNYSYDEKVVGTWVDGSVLYEKTLFFNNKALQKNDNDSELKHGVTNIGSVKFVTEAYCDFNGGQDWKPCQNMIWDNSNNFFQMVVGSTAIYLLSASGVYFSANVNRSYLIKIRYTKS